MPPTATPATETPSGMRGGSGGGGGSVPVVVVESVVETGSVVVTGSVPVAPVVVESWANAAAAPTAARTKQTAIALHTLTRILPSLSDLRRRTKRNRSRRQQ